MGFGFVVARFGIFLRELALGHQSEPSQGGGSLIAGVVLILLGVAVNTYAAFSHVRARRSFQAGEPLPHRMAFSIALASVLALLGVGIAAYLILRAF